MRYDRNYALFAGHTDWYTFVKGIGYVPKANAPPEAVEAMRKYNAYTYHTGRKKVKKCAEKGG